jgi:hypothetical protein
MLVPAMAFAWWLVSVSSGASRAPEVAAASEASGPAAEAAPDAPRQETDSEAAPAEQATDGEGSGTADDTSGERVPVKLVTTGIVRVAKTFLDLPMGAERSAHIDGRRYVFVLERHYHPPGFVGGPHGWHKGVTAYELR